MTVRSHIPKLLFAILHHHKSEELKFLAEGKRIIFCYPSSFIGSSKTILILFSMQVSLLVGHILRDGGWILLFMGTEYWRWSWGKTTNPLWIFICSLPMSFHRHWSDSWPGRIFPTVLACEYITANGIAHTLLDLWSELGANSEFLTMYVDLQRASKVNVQHPPHLHLKNSQWDLWKHPFAPKIRKPRWVHFCIVYPTFSGKSFLDDWILLAYNLVLSTFMFAGILKDPLALHISSRRFPQAAAICD